MIGRIEEEVREGDPESDLWVAISGYQWVDYPSVDVVYDEEAVKDDVHCPVKVLSCDEICQSEEDDPGNCFGDNVRYPSWNGEASIAFGVSSIWHRLEELPEKRDDS